MERKKVPVSNKIKLDGFPPRKNLKEKKMVKFLKKSYAIVIWSQVT